MRPTRRALLATLRRRWPPHKLRRPWVQSGARVGCGSLALDAGPTPNQRSRMTNADWARLLALPRGQWRALGVLLQQQPQPWAATAQREQGNPLMRLKQKHHG